MQPRVCSSGGGGGGGPELFDDVELEVSRILLQLPSLICADGASGLSVYCSWGAKKRRSAISGTKQTFSAGPVPNLSSPVVNPKVAGAMASPTTAFLFPSPDESYVTNSNHSKRLRISNRQRKDDCSTGNSESETGGTLRIAAGPVPFQSAVAAVLNDRWHSQRQPPFAFYRPPSGSDPTDGGDGLYHQCFRHGAMASPRGVSRVGPPPGGIDLNFPPQEAFLQPSDLRSGIISSLDPRAMSRAARQRRVQLQRRKSHNHHRIAAARLLAPLPQ